MIYRLLIVAFNILLFLSVYAQNTTGLISYNDSKAYDGYNLLYPHNQPNVYLLNNCGEIVHTWEGEPDRRPGNTAYLREDGRLVVTSRPVSIQGSPIWAGGGGETIEIKDWDNNVEWSFSLNDSTARLHHDIALVEKLDGSFNILAISWEAISRDEAIQAGRDPAKLSGDYLWPDYIFEIDPSNDEIVWEWHAWDHLIQDFDDTKDNFGVIKDNPGKIDINHDNSGTGAADWLHANSIDFDPFNNIVLLSVPFYNEIWIIDHTTTTAQAATSAGGFSNKGGDLIYRWGDPSKYDAGDSTDQTLFFQHDAHFIDDFVDPISPYYGEISLFNNRAGDNFSTVGIVDHGFEMYDFTFPFADGKFGPDDLLIELQHPVDSTLMFSTGLSSMQILPNGNFLICSGRMGYSYELTPDNEIVWEYRTPLRGGQPIMQGDVTTINENLTFRIRRIPPDYAAFEGRDLSPKGWIELDPNTNYCNILSTAELEDNLGLKVYPNPANEMVTVEWDAGKFVDIEMFTLLGQRIASFPKCNGARKYIDTSVFENGIYILSINGKQASKFIIQR